MLTVSSRFKAACRASHEIALRVDAWADNVLVASDLPVDPDSGMLTVDGESPVRRTLEITIADPSLVPKVHTDLLSPYRTEFRVSRGIRYPDGSTEWCQLGVFRITRPATPLFGAVAVSCADRAKLIQDDIFTLGETPALTATHTSEIQRLIRWSLNGRAPIRCLNSALDRDKPLPAKTVWEQGGSVLDAIEELALTIECEVFVDPTGTFLIQALPRMLPAGIWEINTGDNGVIIAATEEWDRETIHNAAIVRGETTDGSPPVYSTEGDQNRNSPTYWNGPFGHKSRAPFVSPLITTTAQAKRTALELLRRGIAPTRTIRVTMLPMPALEPGDTVTLVLPGARPGMATRYERHMVRGYSMPLGGGAMELDLYTPDPVLPAA